MIVRVRVEAVKQTYMGLEPEIPCTLLLCGLSRSAFGASTGGRYKISGRRKICGLKPPRTSYASMIMDPNLEKHKGLYCSDFSVCAQIVSKNHQEYQNVSKDIELYRNPGAFKNAYIPENFYYFLRVTFFRRFLHTGEVRGSSPLSPTISLFFDLGIKGTHHSLLI